MKTKTFHQTILTILFLTTFHSFIYAQDKTAHDIKLLKAKIIDSTDKKDVIVLFHVSAKDPKDFPPVVSMRLTYSINDEQEKTRNEIRNDKNIQIIIYGNDIEQKNKRIYDLIKNQIDTNSKGGFWILAFVLRDVSSEKVKKMTFTYGLWEKRNQDKRVEIKYAFDVEQ